MTSRLLLAACLLLLLVSPAAAISTPRVYLPAVVHNGGLPPPQPHLDITTLVPAGADEYVRIENVGTAPQTMTDWRILSVEGSQTFYFPTGYILSAGASVRVHSGPGAIHSPPTDLRWTAAYIWNNDGDEARLYNAQGQLIDTWSY